ncbi:hypothetical protein BGZ95_008525 [Linnemannia exigua]|uniref:F-box domain-containing protein n=1 Tax=Linnemannia exigua TaxID=604196 RepID=A0AAD4H7P7_9FUNG|nr:hypothetical protein BGZ95_008525 [Linnemannia exigua]
MNIPPEVLGHIGIYLDYKSLFACTIVCHHWNNVFAPCLWNSVDSNHPPWLGPPFSQDQEVNIRPEEYTHRVLTLVHQHKRHIRDLKVREERLLRAALEADLTGLVSLYLDSTQFFSSTSFNTEVAATAALVPKEYDELIPSVAFCYSSDVGGNINLTRAYWRLVFMNPNLRRLVFYQNAHAHQSGMLVLATDSSVGENGMVTSVLTPTSQGFLLDVLSRLRLLRHVHVGLNADEFLFCNLATHLPNLKSFVHSELVHFNPWTVRLEPHGNLRSLTFTCSISPVQLRAVLVGFPGLDDLTIRRLQDRHDIKQHVSTGGNEDTALATLRWGEDLVHASLKNLSIDEMSIVIARRAPSSGLLRSRTIFPTVTKLRATICIKCALDLGRVLIVLPSAKALNLRGISDSSMGDEDNQETDWQRPQFETFGQDNNNNNYAMVENLEIGRIKFRPSKAMDAVFAQMHFLSRLIFTQCSLDGTTLTALSKYLKNLEHFECSLDYGFSQEFLGLLVGCPKLKKCIGSGHFVLAEDIINSPEWVCLELEMLQIVVVGVPRLTEPQEALLNRMRDQGRPEVAQTVEEQNALYCRQESHALQRKVYQRLGRLPNLRSMYHMIWPYIGDLKDSLEFTLASGLDELSVLDKLEILSFTLLNHRVGEAEDLWMKERLSLLRSKSGGLWYRENVNPL